ncbi:MAG: DUF5681 domain-containing protein [Planctomycetota bacterium]
MTDQTDGSAEYTVGYRKPPEHSRWKPGQSGNPKGRPKKVKDFEKLLDIELDRTISVSEGGRRIPLTKRELILKTLVNDALKSDHRARRLLLPFITKQRTIEGFEPDAGDREAFQEILGRFKDEGEQDQKAPKPERKSTDV